MRHIKTGFYFLCVFIGGFFAGHLGTAIPRTTASDFHENSSSYKFINPLLYCNDENLGNQDIQNLEEEVKSFFAQEKEKKTLLDASFYFRDLNGGPWVLVNHEFKSIPGSLLKVPLAISVYSYAERNPAFLTKKVMLEKDIDANQGEYFKPQKSIQPNVEYSIDEIVTFMLQDSDNTALYLFGKLFTLQELQKDYIHLGIEPPDGVHMDYTMGVKTYASFFRILYNGTYLSRDNSEHILSILSETTFTKGLVAQLPKNLMVAHKFGENISPEGIVQLHDCGIVYKPQQPYIVCVMTKGTDHETLANIISTISKMVYDIVNTPH